MEKKSIKLNYIFNTAYQVLVLIVPLVTTPYISRVLGAEQIGIYSYTYSIISYFLLVAVMGTATYGQRTIAYYQQDIYKRSCKFYEILFFRLITTFISICIYIGYLNAPVCKYRGVATAQIVYLIAVAFDLSWFFQGLEDFKRIVFRNTIAKIFNVILLFVFVRSSDDVIKYTLILSGMTLVANVSIWPYMPSNVTKIKLCDVKPFRNIKEIIQLFIPTIAVQVYAVLDKTMIGYFAVTAAENGYYEQTEKIVRMALAIVTSLGTVMIPRIANLFHSNDYVTMKRYLQKSYQFVWFLGIPIMFGLISVSGIFVPVFYGAGYDKIKILLPIYSCLIIPVAISNVTGCQFLIPTRKQNIYSAAVLLSAVVNLILNLILIPRYLSVGAAIASVTAETVGAVVLLIYVQKNYLIDVVKIFRLSVKNWIAALIMMAIIAGLQEAFAPTIIHLCVLIILGIFIYLIALLLFKDDFFVSNLRIYGKRIFEMVRGKVLRRK